MISNLQVEYYDKNNPKTFRLIDDSEYNPKLTPTGAKLRITPPGFKYAQEYDVKPYFNTVFNASLLNIAKAKSQKDLADLPDGIYGIKYSIDPSDELFVEYDYFRTVKLQEKFAKIACGLLDKKRDYTVNAFQEIKQEILWIRELIEASKYKVETCSDPDGGLNLYNEANFLLNKYVSCITC